MTEQEQAATTSAPAVTKAERNLNNESADPTTSTDFKTESFVIVQMDAADESVVESLFADENEPEICDPLEETPNNDESNDDDAIECFYETLDDFRPMVIKDGYMIKANDILCGNIPFKTNVRTVMHSIWSFFKIFKNLYLISFYFKAKW